MLLGTLVLTKINLQHQALLFLRFLLQVLHQVDMEQEKKVTILNLNQVFKGLINVYFVEVPTVPFYVEFTLLHKNIGK